MSRHAGAAAVALAAVVFAAAPAARSQGKKSKPAGPPPTEEQFVTQAIELALQKHGPDVYRCFEKALADRLDIAGKVEVEVGLGAGGKVVRAKVLSSAADIPVHMADCIVASATGWVIEGVEAGAALVLPFTFAGQMNQFVVRTADVPERGPPAGKGRGGVKIPPPFMVKILADEANVRSQQVSLTLLTVGPASRVAMQRHPRSAKVLYLLKGHARLLGPPGVAPEKIDEGMAVFIPVGYPHAIENMGRQAGAVFMQAFSPPGPERVYRDPGNAKGRADFEVIRDPAKAVSPKGTGPGEKVVVVAASKVESLSILGGKASVRILLDQAATGSPAFGLSLVEFQPGAEVPRHSHKGSTELLHVLSGGGTLTVGSEPMPVGPDQTIFIPADQPHAAKWSATEITSAVQIYAPAGPEQRFRPVAKAAK